MKEQERLAVLLKYIKDGAVVLDSEGYIIQANQTGQGYLALLADANVGSCLTSLGDRLTWELFASPPLGDMGHKVVWTGPPRRIFAVVARPVITELRADGWLLIIREVKETQQNCNNLSHKYNGH